MKFITEHKAILAVIAIVILGVAWYGLYGSSGDAPVLAGGGSTGVDPGESVVRTLSQMHSISLSAAIFSDPAFQGLKDFGTQIVPEPVGRPNPFAPFGFSGPVQQATSSRDVRLFGSQ